uniref:Uncharacterized protein n=1 Tax=Zea mays TaxID=4577 RepID=B4FW11_MAIZE|nr:unknown [Zea mays]
MTWSKKTTNIIASQDLDTLSTLDHVFARYHAIFSIMVL